MRRFWFRLKRRWLGVRVQVYREEWGEWRTVRMPAEEIFRDGKWVGYRVHGPKGGFAGANHFYVDPEHHYMDPGSVTE